MNFGGNCWRNTELFFRKSASGIQPRLRSTKTTSWLMQPISKDNRPLFGATPRSAPCSTARRRRAGRRQQYSNPVSGAGEGGSGPRAAGAAPRHGIQRHRGHGFPASELSENLHVFQEGRDRDSMRITMRGMLAST